MERLIVNPDSDSSWEIELKPGIISLGSDATNDIPIQHPSVSSRHCEINVLNAGVLIKDVGSVGGTFVDGTLVEETLLLPGQVIRLGEVAMRFEAEGHAEAAKPPAPAPQTAFTDNHCKAHPKAAGAFFCAGCGTAFCLLCVNTRISNGRPTRFCRTCGNECTSLQPEAVEAAPEFAKVLGRAFTYPFKHDGVILLVAGTVFYTAMHFLGRFSGLAGVLLMIFGTSYLFSYMQRIVYSSAMGEDRMPDWPDFTDWSDIFGPLLQVAGTVALSFGPLIFLRIFADANNPWPVWAYPTAIAWGCLYFPMSFTAVTMFDSLGALNPVLIFPSILKTFGAYLITVILLVAIFLANSLGADILEEVLRIPVLPGIISEFLGLYLLTVEMRILGQLYWVKKSELGWFRH